MNNIMDLSGKKVIVFGASQGIGRQTAVIFSQLGARLVLVSRRKEKLEETLSMLYGKGHTFYTYDLENTEGIESMLTEITKNGEKFQGLVYSVGVAPTRPYKNNTPDVMKNIMNINFFSFYEVVRQFAKKSFSDDGARIVAVSSAASVRPGKGQAAYAASKAALDASILVYAQELMKRRIGINCIRPGWVLTPMTSDYSVDNPKYNLEMQPMGIIGAEDVGNLAAYLMSDSAKMITGRFFEIDGGRLSRE